MEGFWTVQFSGVQGFGFGVVTLVGGKLYGGDSAFIYTGTYADDGTTLNAKVHVRRGAPGAQSVMGRDQFDLELNGTLNGNSIAASGSIPGIPMRFQATLTKVENVAR